MMFSIELGRIDEQEEKVYLSLSVCLGHCFSDKSTAYWDDKAELLMIYKTMSGKNSTKFKIRWINRNYVL